MKPRLNGGRRSTCASNSALLPSNATDFAMLSAQRFWRETVSLLDVMWPRSNQWERALLGKSIQLYNNKKSCDIIFYENESYMILRSKNH